MSSASGQHLEPFFADTGRGRRFAIADRPADEPRGAILYVPPFAEEMNKSRRMAALTARALAAEGWLVLRCDLQGCGDSEGDSGEATWSGWHEDLSYWAEWLRAETTGPIVLWGLRLGALLATAWAAGTGTSPPLLLWQPVTNGQRHLTQFLRLRAAAQMLDARQASGVVTGLRETLAGGSAVTVAGYTLNPELANPMAEAKLALPSPYAGPVSIIEVAGRSEATVSPAVKALADKWTNSGIESHLSLVTGPPFWQTVEIETAPALIEATVRQANELVA